MSSNAVMNKANEAINKIDTNKKMFGGFMIIILVIIVGFFIYSQIKKEKIISEEMNKMKNLISYNRKTQ